MDEVTPEPLYQRRREFLKDSLLFTATSAGVGARPPQPADGRPQEPAPAPEAARAARHRLQVSRPAAPLSTDERQDAATATSPPTTTSTSSASTRAIRPRTRGTLRDRGPGRSRSRARSRKPQTRRHRRSCSRWFPLEERVYRMRCVEAWSMVIPWLGFPLGDAARSASSRRRARKYVAFTTLLDPEQMPGQRRRVLDWPYVEGLRIDEAMHPLALLAVGPLRQGAAQPERRAAAAGGAVEVRLQGHQVDRARSASPTSSRRRPGTSPRPTSTASTPT